MKIYGYYVDLNERGTFMASVRDHHDRIVYRINTDDGASTLVMMAICSISRTSPDCMRT